MKQEHDLNISCTKIGDYCFLNIALPPDAGGIGIRGKRRKEFLQKHCPAVQRVAVDRQFCWIGLQSKRLHPIMR